MLFPAGVPLTFSIAASSPTLPIAMSVYDNTGAEPALLLSPFAMTVVMGSVYQAKFTAENGKSYVVVMAVYTDDTFTTLDPEYLQESESVNAQYLNAPIQGVVGIVDCIDCEVEGVTESDEAVVGQVDCNGGN